MLMNEELIGEIRSYRADDGKTTLEVSLKEDTVWLSLNHNGIGDVHNQCGEESGLDPTPHILRREQWH